MEKEKRRHLEDLFSSQYIESTTDEKKKRRRKKTRESQSYFDKSLLSQPLCTCWQRKSSFVTVNRRVIASIITMFDFDHDLWVSRSVK